MNVDLDINHYGLSDILTLFKIDAVDFDEADLKKAKRIVLKTHPDKSGLEKDYFLFYTKAYKMLYQIYEFKNKRNTMSTHTSDTAYQSLNGDEEDEKYHKRLIKGMNNKKDFHDWFNKLFVECNGNMADEGYDEWLQSDAGIYTTNGTGNVNDQIRELKNNQNGEFKIVRREFTTLSSQHSHGSTSFDSPSSYSGKQGNLIFNDIKDAFENTIIQVTEDDFKSRKKFNNVNELQFHRKQNEGKVMSKDESNLILKNEQDRQSITAIEQSYKFIKETEQHSQNQDKFWSKLKLLH
uniref:J domain-containing protein n=1 Tax=viral metagenome TaxID=1070528 RepID=A0A6C0JAG1_9ZZZZ